MDYGLRKMENQGSMIPQWIIEKKRDGGTLSETEIGGFISGYVKGDIPDYQMSALAMAIYFKGMNIEETALLTRAMLKSGSRIAPPRNHAPRIDKHSTGGIGDKISLILAPLAACMGLDVPMIAGRGLGITGGTIDKLEAIPGYRTGITATTFSRIVQKCGCSIAAQTGSIAPADRKLYALRDVTGTVPSIPLIVASIVSKKLAASLDGIVYDVKCGSGAFMNSRKDALSLAETLVAVSKTLGLSATSTITNMAMPLGRAAGNSLEVAEALRVMQGEEPGDLLELTCLLVSRMMSLAGKSQGPAADRAKAIAQMRAGRVTSKFADMVGMHGGDIKAVEDPKRLPQARFTLKLAAPEKGVVIGVRADLVGRACLLLGAGRTRVTDEIDPAAGVSDMKLAGETVAAGNTLAILHANSRKRLADAAQAMHDAFAVGRSEKRHPLVLGSVS